MTTHNSRNASNSRNESYNRTANKVWMPAKAGMLVNFRDDSSSDNSISRDLDVTGVLWV